MKISKRKSAIEQSKEQQVVACLLKVANLYAWYGHIPHDDVEDCVLEFVEMMMLRRNKALTNQAHNDHFDSWLNDCAHNHVESFRRRCRTVCKHETQWPLCEEEEGARIVQESIGHEATVDTNLLGDEVRQRIMKAAAQLTSNSREIFLKHFFNEETLLELAVTTGRTPDAIGKVCKRACITIHATLLRQGMMEEDARDYIYIMKIRGGE